MATKAENNKNAPKKSLLAITKPAAPVEKKAAPKKEEPKKVEKEVPSQASNTHSGSAKAEKKPREKKRTAYIIFCDENREDVKSVSLVMVMARIEMPCFWTIFCSLLYLVMH